MDITLINVEVLVGSDEGDFLSFFFSIYGPGSHLGHVNRNVLTNFHSQQPMEVLCEIWL